MKFDECEVRIKGVILKAGKIFREMKGQEEEKNITKLYIEAAEILGVMPVFGRSTEAAALPALYEKKGSDGKLLVPRKDCEKCGAVAEVVLYPLCRSCKEAENGIYHSSWECLKCKDKIKSKKFYVEWLREMGVEFESGLKVWLGIKTITDLGKE